MAVCSMAVCCTAGGSMAVCSMAVGSTAGGSMAGLATRYGILFFGAGVEFGMGAGNVAAG